MRQGRPDTATDQAVRFHKWRPIRAYLKSARSLRRRQVSALPAREEEGRFGGLVVIVETDHRLLLRLQHLLQRASKQAVDHVSQKEDRSILIVGAINGGVMYEYWRGCSKLNSHPYLI